MSSILNAEIPEQPKEAWHQLGIDETAQRLSTSHERGLSEAEAARRLDKYGPNRLQEAPGPTIWQQLWEQFNNFVVLLLVVASLISALLGEWVEAAAILAIVVLNAGFGILQERRAEQALAALRKLASPDAQVVRDGHRQVVHAYELVPGDLVLIEAGNYIPADLRLIETMNLRIEEAALTGESVPIEKSVGRLAAEELPIGDHTNNAFMGTLVNYGRGRGIVVSTGMHTQIGLIARMLQSVHEEPTPLQRRLEELGRFLGWAALAICAAIFLLGWLRGHEPLDMFLIAVSLAIAAVPEGLPAVVTISLALGMREMIRRNALIRKLSSVETLGSATVIGSDKTGTLTQNAMTVTRIWVDGKMIEISGSGYSTRGDFSHAGEQIDLAHLPGVQTALWLAALNNDAELERRGESKDHPIYRVVGDPTEGAMLVAAAKADESFGDLKMFYPRVQEIPFDSERKRMTTIHRVEVPKVEDLSPFTSETEFRDWHVIDVKGAPDLVLHHCNRYLKADATEVELDAQARQHILDANHQMASDALRVIAVAYRLAKDLPEQIEAEDIERDLVFVGLLGMIDPPRPEVVASLQKARAAGIRTVMITGDYPETARAIATQIGLLERGHRVLSGEELSRLSDDQLVEEIQRVDAFARVSPEHKVRIVQALRARGNVVAMTGDGVNDAPALKQADIGVAMGVTGTDVAKETADMVLTDDNYSSIVSAVEQGRIIYGNIRKFVFFLFSCNLSEILIIFLATLVNLPSPLNAIQLLWLNLLTDGAPALALGTEKGDPDVMQQPPRPPKEPIINRRRWLEIGFQTIALTTVTLIAYWLGLTQQPESGDFNHTAATIAFVTLALSELALAFTARSERFPLLRIGPLSNKNMNLAVFISVVLLLGVVYIPFFQHVFGTVPLDWVQWEAVIPLLLVPSVVAEMAKWLLSRPGQQVFPKAL